MTVWFDDKYLCIKFDSEPLISVRYILPSMSEEEKTSVKKYPFINKFNLEVLLEDKRKQKKYLFTIPKMYCFDGASIPRLFWRLIGPNTDNKFLIPAMIHDYMCENHCCVDYDRELSTRVFDSLLKISGVKNYKRFLMKNSVNIFQKCFCNWRE
jgi:hypothetical protein